MSEAPGSASPVRGLVKSAETMWLSGNRRAASSTIARAAAEPPEAIGLPSLTRPETRSAAPAARATPTTVITSLFSFTCFKLLRGSRRPHWSCRCAGRGLPRRQLSACPRQFSATPPATRASTSELDYRAGKPLYIESASFRAGSRATYWHRGLDCVAGFCRSGGGALGAKDDTDPSAQARVASSARRRHRRFVFVRALLVATVLGCLAACGADASLPVCEPPRGDAWDADCGAVMTVFRVLASDAGGAIVCLAVAVHPDFGATRCSR